MSITTEPSRQNILTGPQKTYQQPSLDSKPMPKQSGNAKIGEWLRGKYGDSSIQPELVSGVQTATRPSNASTTEASPTPSGPYTPYNIPQANYEIDFDKDTTLQVDPKTGNLLTNECSGSSCTQVNADLSDPKWANVLENMTEGGLKSLMSNLAQASNNINQDALTNFMDKFKDNKNVYDRLTNIKNELFPSQSKASEQAAGSSQSPESQVTPSKTPVPQETTEQQKETTPQKQTETKARPSIASLASKDNKDVQNEIDAGKDKTVSNIGDGKAFNDSNCGTLTQNGDNASQFNIGSQIVRDALNQKTDGTTSGDALSSGKFENDTLGKELASKAQLTAEEAQAVKNAFGDVVVKNGKIYVSPSKEALAKASGPVDMLAVDPKSELGQLLQKAYGADVANTVKDQVEKIEKAKTEQTEQTQKSQQKGTNQPNNPRISQFTGRDGAAVANAINKGDADEIAKLGDGKGNIIVKIGSTSCPPCRKFESDLQQSKQTINGKEYTVVTLTNTNAQTKLGGGIPEFQVYDSTGKYLGAQTGYSGNITSFLDTLNNRYKK